MSRMGRARRAIQQPTEQNPTATFIVPPSTHEIVAPRATMITHSTNPLHHGFAVPRRPDHHRHPTMMSILPTQTTVHHALESAGPMPRSFNRVNSPHTQNINQFSVVPTSSFTSHGYITSSSSVEGILPYRGVAVTQGQSSTSTLNYHLPSPNDYAQINAAVPEIAGNAMRLQNTISYSAPAGTPDENTQVGVASPGIIWSPHVYSALNPYHNSNGLHNALYNDLTQASTASWPYGVPAMGNDSQLSYSPPMQSSNTRTPHDSQQQWHSSASYPPQADVLRSQPDVPTTSTSPPGRGRGDHVNHPSRSCRWLGCVFEGSIDELKRHFTNSHLTGPQDARITCLWDGCHYSRRGRPEVDTMRRDSVWRHVLEKHLDVKYRKKA
ncbi:hypothetical protein AZE42_10543 [Rhizopogon vesiculosus]|uniref:Uncharacterized protein n=1 Tax=Rhizopogon vesiculosus TaxID=180088 RepID=A0A1J8QRV8_9AGAM|nr:hypothetical protein AZE42_10543 [Rhizopogon vesiculosus]